MRVQRFTKNKHTLIVIIFKSDEDVLYFIVNSVIINAHFTNKLVIFLYISPITIKIVVYAITSAYLTDL